jgi:hypothetical protein
LNPKRVAIIYDITQEVLRAEAELIRDLASKTGYETVAFEAFCVHVSIFSGYGVFQDPTYWDLSNGRIKGAINWVVAFDLASTDPKMQKVVTDDKSFPEEPTIYSVYGYQALQAAVDAVKRACTATDCKKFRGALAKPN